MKDDKVIYGTSSDFIFKEALEFLKKKKVVISEDFKQMQDAYKSLAFTVEGYTSLEILKKFQEELADAIENGTTKKEFQEKMNTFLEEKGYKGMNPHQADTVFRTNVQTAFNAGHYKSMSDPTTKKLRPYWKYVTAGDNKVRDDHAVMDDRVYSADDPIWDIWYPPNGFKCRCSVISLSKDQFEKGGYILEKKIPNLIEVGTGVTKPIFPDKGFSNNPAKAIWKPDLSDYPTNLKEVFKERNKAKK